MLTLYIPRPEPNLDNFVFKTSIQVQVALATGVSLHDTVKLLPDSCDIRRAKFVAETACALGGAGCSQQETIELIGELHPQQLLQQQDAVESCPAEAVAASHLQQPSLHAWLNRPDQAKFLRACCSVASISQAMSAASCSNSHVSLPASQSLPSQLVAACALSLFGTALDHHDIGLVLDTLPPNSFLDLVKAGVAHIRDQNVKTSDVIGSFDVLLGYLGVCSTNSGMSKNANANICSTSMLRTWFSTVLAIDSICMQIQGIFMTGCFYLILVPCDDLFVGLNWIEQGNRMQSKMRTDAIECVLFALIEFNLENPTRFNFLKRFY